MPKFCTYHVEGMHCASCERVIGDALRKLPGVLEVRVRLGKTKATIQLADGAADPDLATVNRELAPLGYHLSPPGADRSACVLPVKPLPWKRRLFEAFLMLAGIGLALRIGAPIVARFVPTVSATGSLFALFGLGIVASLSTCLASTGAFLLAYSAEGKGRAKAFWIQSGRLASFVVGGALLGALGGALPTGNLFYGLVGLLFGIGFLLTGLHLMGLTPSVSSLGVRLPSRFNALADRVSKRDGRLTPVLVGAVTFLLPCGFTQTAQAIALTSGSAAKGAAIMFAFALGTLPVLTGLTAFGTTATLKHRFVRLATGALLVLFAFGQLDGGLTVLGSPVTFGALAGRVAGSVAPVPAQAQEQVVGMTVAYGAFSPSRFTIKKGVPVLWEVDGVDISGCANAIVSPKLNLNQTLKLGLNVIRFTPRTTGVIPFSCPMGMIRGSFNVVD